MDLRDGLQNEADTVSTADKVEFIRLLAHSGLQEIEVASFVNPKWVPQLADAKELVEELEDLPGLRYSALVPNMRGLERAIEAGISRIAVFTAASETFNRRNINMGIRESLDAFRPVVETALEADISPCGAMCPPAGCAPTKGR